MVLNFFRGDGCLKASRYKSSARGLQIPYWLPNSIFLDTRQTNAALQELHATISDPSNMCSGVDGSSTWKAAAKSSGSNALERHGAYVVVCGHELEVGHAAIEMNEPETVRGHQTLGLAYAFSQYCQQYLNDTMCILRRSVNSAYRDISKVLRIFQRDPDGLTVMVDDSECTVTIGGDESAASPVSNVGDQPSTSMDQVDSSTKSVSVELAMAHEDFAEFKFRPLVTPRVTVPEINVNIGTPVAVVPESPSDFDLKHAAECVICRSQSDKNKVTGSVATLHACGHQCSRSTSVRVTPGAGYGNEWPEWDFFMTLSPHSSRASRNWLLFHNRNMSLYNQSKAMDVVRELLKLFVRAAVCLEKHCNVLNTQKAA